MKVTKFNSSLQRADSVPVSIAEEIGAPTQTIHRAKS